MLLSGPVEMILVGLMAALSCDGYLLSMRVALALGMLFTIRGRSESVIIRINSTPASSAREDPILEIVERFGSNTAQPSARFFSFHL